MVVNCFIKALLVIKYKDFVEIIEIMNKRKLLASIKTKTDFIDTL